MVPFSWKQVWFQDGRVLSLLHTLLKEEVHGRGRFFHREFA
jgi:hypothetical protein